MIGIAHTVVPAGIDESLLLGESPPAHAERLARAKVEVVAARNPSLVVIGADTIVVVDGQVLGKPVDAAEAVRMLQRLSGRVHTVHTAVAVAVNARTESAIESVAVEFRTLDDEEIADYVATGEPMDKAGAYGIQGFGATIVRRIEGDYFAVMGLSLTLLVSLLHRHGIVYRFGMLAAPVRAAE